jgi:chaperonin cofactor prefoldin
MSKKAELSKAIQSLRVEIETLEDSDSETREHLAQLADLMETQLHGRAPTDDTSTADTVMDMIETYEARYPRITAMANDLMTRLAAMGI